MESDVSFVCSKRDFHDVARVRDLVFSHVLFFFCQLV